MPLHGSKRQIDRPRGLFCRSHAWQRAVRRPADKPAAKRDCGKKVRVAYQSGAWIRAEASPGITACAQFSQLRDVCHQNLHCCRVCRRRRQSDHSITTPRPNLLGTRMTSVNILRPTMPAREWGVNQRSGAVLGLPRLLSASARVMWKWTVRRKQFKPGLGERHRHTPVTPT